MRPLLALLATSCAAVSPDELHLSHGRGHLYGDIGPRLDSHEDYHETTVGLTWYLAEPSLDPLRRRICPEASVSSSTATPALEAPEVLSREISPQEGSEVPWTEILTALSTLVLILGGQRGVKAYQSRRAEP